MLFKCMRYATILQPGQIWHASDADEPARIIVDIYRTRLLYRIQNARQQAEPTMVSRSEFRQWITEAGAELFGLADDDQSKASPSAELGKRIIALRKAAGLTQQQVAKALNISRPAVAFWETGREGSVKKHLAGLATLLGVSIETLLSGQLEQLIDIKVTPDEADFIALYRRLSPSRKLHAQRWIERQTSPLNITDA